MPATIRVNPGPLQSIVITCAASDAAPNLSGVTAANILMLNTDGVESALSATFTTSSSSCVVTHVFAAGELSKVGAYKFKPVLTLPGGQIEGEPVVVQAISRWD